MELATKLPRSRRVVAEAIGTAMLLTAIVGSGIMCARLGGGNVAVALLANSLATGVALIALILALGLISGAHLNPIVTLEEASQGLLPWREMPAYLAIQCLAAVTGVIIAHLMFGLPVISLSTRTRGGIAQFISDFVATFGSMVVIRGCSCRRPSAVATRSALT